MQHRAIDRNAPLFVDCDGTLTAADISLESFVSYGRRGFLPFFRLLYWLLLGRSVAKAMVARHAPVDPATLPYRPEVIAFIERERAAGRRVILASASHRRNMLRIARHLGLFDGVIGTTAKHNLKGGAKLARMRLFCGEEPFDYVGDSPADGKIWSAARMGFTVRHVPRGSRVEALMARESSTLAAIVRAMRPHQWAKNGLVFVPLVTAGSVADPHAWALSILAALCFSLIASGIYIANDLLDIASDRVHATKRFRPLAAGTLSIPVAILAAAVLVLLPLVLSGLLIGSATTWVLLCYLGLTTAYSLRLKAVMTLDVITLALLYTVRIFAGSTAIGVTLSFWLLSFSVFFFLSLAYLKRYTELSTASAPNRLIGGRGYLPEDREVVGIAGISAGMVSILVLALFINAVRDDAAYPTPDILWLLCLPLLYWINRVWMMARRGEVEGDPVAFAVRDARSLMLAAIMGLIVIAAQNVRL